MSDFQRRACVNQWRVAAVALAAVLVGPPAWAQSSPCFDLNRAVTKPLVEPPAAEPASDIADSGEKKDGRVWARLRGQVKKPISRLLAAMMDHERLRDPSIDELKVEQRSHGPHLARRRVYSVVHPFPFVTVEWTDEWAYTLVEGTASAPEKIVISYQKIEGTSHIAHYCGNLVLRRIDETSTEVYQYEESKITSRDVKDQAQGLLTLLSFLRTKA